MKQKLIAFIALFGFLGFVTMPLQAAMVTTPDVIASEQAEYDRGQLLELLDRDDIQEQLLAMGVSAEHVQDRVNNMTDIEVAQLNDQLQNMPAGSGVIGVVLIVFIVFVVTDVLGATDIFPFIRPAR